MKRILFTIIATAGLVSAPEVLGQPGAKGRSESSRVTGETATLRKGERFRRRATGGVDVVDIATGKTNITVECFCDSDKGPVAGYCDEEIVDEKVRCKDSGCGDCDMHETGDFKGDDKLQTEPPSGGGAPVYRPESGETEETKKWTITPNPQLKGLTGSLVVSLPQGTEYVVYIYKTGTNELSKGESGMTSVSLLPRLYDVVLNTGSSDTARRWRVTGVPVESGKDTRLHAGVLNVTVNGIWGVYDEARQVRIVGGHGPKRIGLLAGRYQIKIANDFMPVVIRDGQVTSF